MTVSQPEVHDDMEIIEVGKEKNFKILSVKGRMDAVSAPEFEEKMRSWIDEGETRFIIDLDQLNYMSSAGLRSIIKIVKNVETKNGKIICCALAGEVNKIFKISGFSSIIPTYESVAAALEKI